MKRGIMLATVGVLGLLVVGTVSAHRSKVPTTHVPVTITHDGDVTLGNGGAILTGHLKTRRVACRSLSQVVVKAYLANGSTKPVDADLTSSRGAWSVKANLAGVDHFRAKVLRKKILTGGRGGYGARPGLRRLVCEGDAVTWRVD
jgi:hypothetical protein